MLKSEAVQREKKHDCSSKKEMENFTTEKPPETIVVEEETRKTTLFPNVNTILWLQ